MRTTYPRDVVRQAIAMVAGTFVAVVCTSSAHAETEACQRAIAREAAKLAQATAKALATCEDLKLKGTISFDHCLAGGNPVPPPPVAAFTCAMRSASDEFNQLIDPPSLVDCQPITP